MSQLISDGDAEPNGFRLARKEDVEEHIEKLRELAVVVNRAMCHMMAFDLRIGFSIRELETACVQASVTDLHRTKGLLTSREVARKLGVSIDELRNDPTGELPKPVRGSGNRALYARADVDRWLRDRL